MAPAVRSSLDVALWFQAAAKESGVRLQPLTLQRLLYLAQVRYAVIHDGAKLMPATFVASAELGPIEPTVQHAFEHGPPAIKAEPPEDAVESLLYEVWRRSGRKSPAELSAVVKADLAYQTALDAGPDSEIVLARREAGARRKARAKGEEGDRPSVVGMMTMDGRRIRKWLPGMKSDGRVAPVPDRVGAPQPGDRVAGPERRTVDGRRITKWVPGMKRADLAR